MGFYKRGPHTFYFDYELERNGELLEVEVSYVVEDDDLWLDSIRFEGKELETTGDEDREIFAHASERVNEDLIDAEADYGDYLYDLRRDMED